MRKLGVDIGGTNIKWVILESSETVERGSVPSFASLGRERLLSALFSLLDGLRFDLVGISTAGIVAPDGSILYANENIPDYTGTPLKALLEEKYGKPAYVLNDISAAAFSEIGCGSDDFYYLALGTGVGGVHVLGGQVMGGVSGIAGQIGYLRSSCGGLVDLDASSRGLSQLSPDGDPRILFSRAEDDAEAQEILASWCRTVGYLIMEIIGFINPRTIVIGGGISEQGDKLLSRLGTALEEILPPPYRGTVTLTVARGGNYAGALGAVAYAERQLGGSCG